MIMDIQKFARGGDGDNGLKISQPSRSSSVGEAENYSAVKMDLQHNKTSKRSFDVAFLMQPDDRFKQRQSTEKQLRVSKQLFINQEWTSLRNSTDERNKSPCNSKCQEFVKVPEKCPNLSPSLCFDDNRYRSTNVSPSLSQELNIDVGTDEYPPKSVLSDSDVSDMSRSRPNSADSVARPIRYIPESPFKNKVFDDPMLIMQSRVRFDQIGRYPNDRNMESIHKSAFTKVSNSYPSNLSSNAAAASPDPSVSPDNLMYQNSVSPPLTNVSSATVSNIFNKSPQFKGLLSSNHPLLSAANPFLKSQHLSAYQSQYLDQQLSGMSSLGGETSYGKSQEYAGEKQNSEIVKPIQLSPSTKFNHLLPFRPDLPAYLQSGASYPFPVQNFQQHGGGEFPKFQPQPREQMNHLMGSPAAAILSTLLPPTLAAFSLPAQNVCAKCNISFRMTSDLVYHMRSHHKNEVHHDSNRRKREDKLKCPVCAESFRERHHLTRHMTAHQDKESDAEDQQEGSKANFSGKNKSKSYFNHNGSVTMAHK